VRGRIDGPGIWLWPERKEGAKRPAIEEAFPAGHHHLKVTCRDVSRTALVERTAEVELDVEPGRIYDLEAPSFSAPEHRCEVQVKVVPVAPATP
jgi:hypothetical protein